MRALLAVVLSLLLSSAVFAEALNGSVEKKDLFGGDSQVVDSTTGDGIPNARVGLPSKNYSTRTDENGHFSLNSPVDKPTIMSVDKDGYKPFSVTIDQTSASKPIVIGIEKANPQNVVVESDLIHLGDNSYSAESANAGEFSSKSVGAFYTKSFPIKGLKGDEDAYLYIGSIIGIDTLAARKMGQSKVTTAYAEAPQVFCNGNKIAEIKINGDGQEIKIPKQLINPSGDNEITIKAGKNLFQSAYIDYDDIEFTNLQVEIK